ncbi:hypothetical protein CENSYa_0572 [Cenarchaeum symbiosum A]|uniref:Nucleotidyl transferase AbiEii/AbiGii toxin family protein n=1 Tax=Cenarchaeum symbiosum (strain A) TaxID=414004 RepID=A0RV38_CENSY|nr:hypothetical protein CENSYa_0572 [Cenarchaeum symbiosum A]
MDSEVRRLYDKFETRISKDNMLHVLSAVEGPACLVGGWAVYLTVNEKYEELYGRTYQESRDIDIAFHFSKNETADSLHISPFYQAVQALKNLEYEWSGFRLLREYDRDSMVPLAQEAAKKRPSFELFRLYVDLIADNVPENFQDVMGFTPVNQRIFEPIFTENLSVTKEISGVKVTLPAIEVLVASKTISMPDRPPDHKKTKDIMDVFTLIWQSEDRLAEMKADMLRLLSKYHGQEHPQKYVEQAFAKVSQSDCDDAAKPLGIDPAMITDALDNFARLPV